jgi:hypothetical protein
MSMGVLPLKKKYQIGHHSKTPQTLGNNQEGHLGVETGW